jgi:nicotinate dehydrogenase subunit B
MTEQISRRAFLGGAVVVGFSFTATMASVSRAGAAASGTGSDIQSGGDIQNAWLVVQAAHERGTGTSITVYSPKVELGTGTQTALSQIVVEELYADIRQLRWVQGDTSFDPAADPNSQGYTAGSTTVQVEGPTLRLAAAAAFQALQALALSYFGTVSPAQLTAANGVFFYGQKKASYGQVIGSQTVTAAPGSSTTTKSYTEYTVVGQPVPRVDLPEKFLAEFTYSADVRLPGMRYARVVRPSGRNATFAGWGPGYATALGYAGIVGIYQTGNFIYVLSTDEGTAAEVVTNLGPTIASWTDGPALVPQASLPTALTSTQYVYASDNQVLAGDPGGAFASAPQQATATYFTPFQMHGSLGASASVAEWDGQTLTIYSGTQGPGPLQSAIEGMLSQYDPGFSGSVRIIYTEQAGCYGHDGADDSSAEAALIAYQRGGAVKVQWSRADEHQWEPLSPAMVHQMQGGVASGSVVSWQHDVYSPTHDTRPAAGAGAGNLLVAEYLGVAPAPMPPLDSPIYATRNAPVNYAFANSRTGRHFVTSFQLQSGSMDASSPLTWVLPRSTALRSLGGFSNTFANESFMDELAHLADPNLAENDPLALQFRLGYLSADARAVAVLEAVAKMPGGPVRTPASGHATGRGLAYMQYENDYTYVATIVGVDVDLSTGQVTVTDVYVAHDCGLVINPDGLRNQIQGNVIQGVSRTLFEEVDYSGDQVTQNGWQNYESTVVGYQVIGFDQIPNIAIQLLDHPDQPAWGAGEPGILPMAAAIGNAIFNATGSARIRTLPITPAAVLAAL